MKIKDYETLTAAALVKYPVIRSDVADLVSPAIFADDKLQIVVECCYKYDTLTELVEDKAISDIGGLPYIRNLTKNLSRFGRVTIREVREWLLILSNEEKKRHSSDLVDIAYEELDKLSFLDNPDSIIRSLMAGLSDTFSSKSSKGFISLGEAADELVADLLNLSNGIVVDKLPTGFKSWDKHLQGGLPKGMISLAGTPGVGKTQLMIQLLRNVGVYTMKRVAEGGPPGVSAMVSREMKRKKLLERAAQAETGITVEVGMLKSDAKRCVKAVRSLAELPIMVDDSDMMSTSLIFSRMEALFLRYGLIDLLGIDFAELVIDDDFEGNMEQQVGKVYIRSGILARRYDCSVMVVSHLTKESEKSSTKVPSMNQMRYTRLAEALSEMVMLIYYPYHYIKTGHKIVTPATMPATPGTAYIITGKYRSGPTGIKPMGWTPECTRWSDTPTEGLYHKVTSDDIFNVE